MLKIIADTNTLISASITEGNEFEILRLAKSGKIKLILSLEILKEFKDVISRPKFGFSGHQIEASVKQLINICEMVNPSTKIDIIKDDPDDNKILECAITAKADYIISGDDHLLALREYKKIKIMKSAEIMKVIYAPT